jgi:hypothetical protein
VDQSRTPGSRPNPEIEILDLFFDEAFKLVDNLGINPFSLQQGYVAGSTDHQTGEYPHYVL